MCKVSRTYSVAGFFFRVRAEAALLDEMDNLRPFEVPGQARDDEKGVRDDEFLFTLEQGANLPEETGAPVFHRGDGPEAPEMAIFELAKSYLFRLRPLPGCPFAAWLEVDRSFSQARLLLSGSDNAFGLNSSLLILLSFTMATRGAFEIQSSVVMHEGRGFLFLGPDGTGKTTHSHLWLEHFPGTELLSDDYPIIRIMPDGSAWVYGTPWSGKTPCFKPVGVPVGAMVRLRQASENTISRISPQEARNILMVATPAFRPFPHQAEGLHRTHQTLAETVPFYSLCCRPDEAAARLCRETVLGAQE